MLVHLIPALQNSSRVGSHRVETMRQSTEKFLASLSFPAMDSLGSRFGLCLRTCARQLQVRAAPLRTTPSGLGTLSQCLQWNQALSGSCLGSTRHLAESARRQQYREDQLRQFGIQTRWFAATHEILANRDIPFQRVRVVDDSGLVGDFHIQEALTLAKQRRTDLVVLSGQVDPPLCRLVNLHVYIDELEKQAASKEQKRRENQLREFSFDPAMRVKGWVGEMLSFTKYCVIEELGI